MELSLGVIPSADSSLALIRTGKTGAKKAVGRPYCSQPFARGTVGLAESPMGGLAEDGKWPA